MTIQFLRGTTAKTATYTGANGELTVDTTKKAVVVHDATKAGGYAQATEAGVQASAYNTASAAGAADALTAVFTPAITALTNGMTLYVRASAANTTTTPTFTPAPGTIAAKAIVKGAGSALAAGDIAGPGHWIELQYDLTLDKWVLQNAAKGVSIMSQLPGEVCYFAMSTAPSGFLKANGAAVSRTTYAALFAAIGTTFGPGDGSTTFNLPDLRGEFLRGWDDSRGIDGGRALGSAQLDAFQGHFHDGATGSGGYNQKASSSMTSPVTGGGVDTRINGWNPQTGQNGAVRYGDETRPRNIALLACIKY